MFNVTLEPQRPESILYWPESISSVTRLNSRAIVRAFSFSTLADRVGRKAVSLMYLYRERSRRE